MLSWLVINWKGLILVIPHVASDLRNLSTSVDLGNVVNEKGFETFYIQASYYYYYFPYSKEMNVVEG